MPSNRVKTEKSDVLPKEDKKAPFFIYIVTILSAVGGFLFGYDTGVISGAMLLLKTRFELNKEMRELVVSITILGAWIFCLLGGYLADKFGRKPIIIVASFIFTAGAILMGLATSIVEIICGRFIVGIGIGLASMTVPMYIAEVAPANIRGRLVTINNCSITFGQLISCIIDGIFASDLNNGWRYMLGLAGVPAVIQFFGFFLMPESPRWLVANKKYVEALMVLEKIRNQDTDVDEEFQIIKDSCLELEKQREQQNGSRFILIQVLKMPHLRRALMVGCGLQMIQQLAGINTIMYYSAAVIEMSGQKDIVTIVWLSCAAGGVNSLFSLLALFFVEKVGRRILTLVSLGGVILSLAFLGVSFQLADFHSPAIAANSSLDSQCMPYGSCASCILDSNCGYCFYQTPKNAPPNGTCLMINHTLATGDDRSIHGPCSENVLPGNLYFAEDWCPTSFFWMTFTGLLLYLMFFAPGMGPMPWTINSEIYPLWARSVCYSTATSFNWLFNFAVSASFLSLTQALTKYGAFYFYTGIATLGFIFLFLMLPETKGKSLEEVEGLFIHPYYKEMSAKDEKKVVQYVHIRGINHAYTADDSDEDDDS